MNNKVIWIIFLLFLILIVSVSYLFIKWNKETIKNTENTEIVIDNNIDNNKTNNVEIDNINNENVKEEQIETIDEIETIIPQDIELLELESILWEKDKEFLEIVKSLAN